MELKLVIGDITYASALRFAQDSRRSPERRRGKLILDIYLNNELWVNVKD